MPNNLKKYDANQVLRSVFDVDRNTLRVSVIDGSTGDGSGFEVIISHTDDSIRLGDGTNFFTSTTVGPKVGLDVNVISGTLPLPTGAATEAKQDVGNASLASIDSKIVHVDTNNTIITSSVLPTGASTSANQVIANASLASIDSKLTAPISVTGPLTDVQLRASPVPVSGTITVNQGTSPWVTSRNWVLSSGTDSVSAVQSGIWTTGRTWALTSGTDSVAAVQSGTWNINNITGTVSLPTGAATAANQVIANASLASIDADFNVALSTRASEATVATLLTTAAFQARINTLGQKTAANSTPVVIASDQTPLVANNSSVTSVNVANANTLVLAVNLNRKGASFYNDGGGVIYLKLGATASATSYTVRMPDNTFYELPYPVYTGIIDAISAAGTRSLRVTELT